VILPYGVDDHGHVVVPWGDEVIDLARADGIEVDREIFASGSLDAFMALGADVWERTRVQLGRVIDDQPVRARRPVADTGLVLPWTVGDYADFYASREHVETMGSMLRPGEEPLPPAWLHLPMGYHGRAGTVIVSGEPVPRPWGIRPGPSGPEYGPSHRLDVEVELGFVVGTGVPRGSTVSAADAEELLFGMVLLNDWSARDIQAFEYRPLGPFLGKSFATSVSPWVVPWRDLDPYRVPGPAQDPTPAAYLAAREPRNLAVDLALSVNGVIVSRMSSATLYWSPAQQLAHLTANGAGVRAGDLFATGTVSNRGRAAAGSLMEAWDNERFLRDGDLVTIEGWCDGTSVGAVTAEVTTR
jgi:fumarylacetoacetase